MIKRIFFLSIVVISLGACKKKSDTCPYTDANYAAPASEITALQNWLNSNGITATQHSSGIFYIVTAPGSGATASVCSNVTVKYTGTLLNNSQFDQNLTGYTDTLGALILGWQKGLQLIKAGGSITLYIPPSLGYGSQDIRNSGGAIVIPANSNLKFTIDLVSVQ